MAQILVRNLDDDIKAKLAEKARRHGVSLEEEARTALRAAAFAPEPQVGLGTEIANLFRGIGLEDGEELELPRDEPSRPAVFDE
jgi:plasmid stability protein